MTAICEKIRRVIEIMLGATADRQVTHARLHARAATNGVNVEDLFKARHHQQHTFSSGSTPPESPVPAPRVTTGTRRRWRERPIAVTCSICSAEQPVMDACNTRSTRHTRKDGIFLIDMQDLQVKGHAHAVPSVPMQVTSGKAPSRRSSYKMLKSSFALLCCVAADFCALLL